MFYVSRKLLGSGSTDLMLYGDLLLAVSGFWLSFWFILSSERASILIFAVRKRRVSVLVGFVTSIFSRELVFSLVLLKIGSPLLG